MRLYATEDETGLQFLLHIKCDYCEATIAPYEEIANSGWTNYGFRVTPRDSFSIIDMCPKHRGEHDNDRH